MKKFIFIMLLIGSVTNASGVSGRWHGFNTYLASLGGNSYELTLYRDGSKPATASDLKLAELKVLVTCDHGSVITNEYLTNDSKAAVTVDFICKKSR